MNKSHYVVATILFLSGMFFANCTDDKLPEEVLCVYPDSLITYNMQVAEIISSQCSYASCHDAGSVDGDYTTYQNMKSSGDFDDGDFRKRVLIVQNMPKYNNLSEEEFQIMECWINAGFPEE